MPTSKTTRKSRRSRATDVSGDVEEQLCSIERSGGDGVVVFGRASTLKVSSLGKAFFPDAGVTKGGVMRYYARLWPQMEPVVADRPLILKRYPDGVGSTMFYQQNAGKNVPEGVRVEDVEAHDDGPKSRIIGGNLATLLHAVQLGAIEVQRS